MEKAKIVLFKKTINFFKLIQKLTCKPHPNLSLKTLKKLNLVLTLKLSKRLWLTLSNSKRSMLTRVWFKMTSYQCTTTLETFPVITSWMMLETKERVALATQLASYKLSTPVSSSSMEKRPKIFLHNKCWTAISWWKAAVEDGLTLMPTSTSTPIWLENSVLHTLLLQKDHPALNSLHARQLPRFSRPNTLEVVLPRCQRKKWWKTSLEMDLFQLNFKLIKSLEHISTVFFQKKELLASSKLLTNLKPLKLNKVSSKTLQHWSNNCQDQALTLGKFSHTCLHLHKMDNCSNLTLIWNSRRANRLSQLKLYQVIRPWSKGETHSIISHIPCS